MHIFGFKKKGGRKNSGGKVIEIMALCLLVGSIVGWYIGHADLLHMKKGEQSTVEPTGNQTVYQPDEGYTDAIRQMLEGYFSALSEGDYIAAYEYYPSRGEAIHGWTSFDNFVQAVQKDKNGCRYKEVWLDSIEHGEFNAESGEYPFRVILRSAYVTELIPLSVFSWSDQIKLEVAQISKSNLVEDSPGWVPGQGKTFITLKTKIANNSGSDVRYEWPSDDFRLIAHHDGGEGTEAVQKMFSSESVINAGSVNNSVIQFEADNVQRYTLQVGENESVVINFSSDESKQVELTDESTRLLEYKAKKIGDRWIFIEWSSFE